jgi:hypothetical protein
VRTIKYAVSCIAIRIPGNLVIFVAAIFLSNGINVFTNIYTQPGKPSHSFGLWCSCVSSVLAAALWTALAAKKEAIDRAVISGAGSPDQRETVRVQMWNDVWFKTMTYLFGAIVFSALAMIVLIISF